jgi:hypothetical protein
VRRPLITVCATVFLGGLHYAATPAAADICTIANQIMLPCSGPNGCQVWVSSHTCSGYCGGCLTCGCNQTITCCGHSFTKIPTMACGNSCVGCTSEDKTGARIGSGRPVSNQRNVGRRRARATIGKTATPTQSGQSVRPAQ